MDSRQPPRLGSIDLQGPQEWVRSVLLQACSKLLDKVVDVEDLTLDDGTRDLAMTLAGAFPGAPPTIQNVIDYMTQNTVLHIVRQDDLRLMAPALMGPLERLRRCASCKSNVPCAQRCLDACQSALGVFKAHCLRQRRLLAFFTDERGLAALLRAELDAALEGRHWSRIEVQQELGASTTQKQYTDLVLADRQAGLVYYIEIKKNPNLKNITKDQGRVKSLLNDAQVRAPGHMSPGRASRVGYQLIFCAPEYRVSTAQTQPRQDPPQTQPRQDPPQTHLRQVTAFYDSYKAGKWMRKVNLNQGVTSLTEHNVYCLLLKVEAV